jgi:hypothetical protein
MGLYRRFAGAAPAMFLLACGQAAPAPDAGTHAAAPPGVTRFICDAIDAPTIVVARASADGSVTLREFDQTRAEFVADLHASTTESEGAAGSVFTTFMDGATHVATVRALNPDVLEEPSEAYTAPVADVRLGERAMTCRWLARTRLAGFTTRRSIVISEDDDGDLIYQSFDFAQADDAQRVDLDGAQRTTTISLEARGGSEETGPQGMAMRFEREGYAYVVSVSEAGEAALSIEQNGAPVQSEALIAFQTPPGME